jgi:hypothetical protein
MNTVIPYPTWAFREAIMACWAKLYFTYFLHKKQVYMNAGMYGTLISLYIYIYIYIYIYLDIQHLDIASEAHADSTSSTVTFLLLYR